MATLRLRSFEKLFNLFFVLSLVLLVVILAVVAYLIDASLLAITTVLLIGVLPYCLCAWLVKNAIKTPLQGLSVALEAIRLEDYSLRPNSKFNAGVFKTLSDEINLLAEDLRVRKLQYDQQAVLVLNLIEQLATPIAVFDQEGRLYHANDAFSIWCGHQRQQTKLLSASALGLVFHPSKGSDIAAPEWRIKDTTTAAHWQLRHSGFSMSGASYHLVILTNIEKVVIETERLAWQKMTRVLSHEINNSLSPIKSLAQSLVDVFSQKSVDKGSIEALEIIVARSNNLMQFVNRYASLNQQYDINLEPLALAPVLEKVIALFESVVEIENCAVEIEADAILLEQVLINVIKNAIEASPAQEPVKVSAKQMGQKISILVEDCGSGIANPENLFVPFYTTKDNGRGIGLALSRNMIEQQGGRLTLQNKGIEAGAQAVITLPRINSM